LASNKLIIIKTEMNHGELGAHGVQTKEGLGVAKFHKAKDVSLIR
jgi:hypothetical protein